jgi:hypothetical protein
VASTWRCDRRTRRLGATSQRGGKTLSDLLFSTIVDSLLEALPEIKRQHDALQVDIGPDVLAYPAIELVNLLSVGIFKPWAGDPKTLSRAWKYMGESTKEIARDQAHQACRGENLPE